MKTATASTPPARPVPTVVALLVGLALLLAGCGGGHSSTGSSGTPRSGASSASPSAVAFAACMRGHGVPSYPDPDSSGQLPKGSAQQFGVSSSDYAAAQQACRRLLPTGGSFFQQFQQCVSSGSCPQQLVQEALTKQRTFARCMRAHGVPSFPDPRIGPGGAPFFPVSAAGLTHEYTHSPEFTSKAQVCQRAAGGSVPVLMG